MKKNNYSFPDWTVIKGPETLPDPGDYVLCQTVDGDIIRLAITSYGDDNDYGDDDECCDNNYCWHNNEMEFIEPDYICAWMPSPELCDVD